MSTSAEDIQARLDGPPPTHHRNINIDTHIGQAPQRPYALLEDQLASVTTGYRDGAALKAALAGQDAPPDLPEGAPNPNELIEDDAGLGRYVIAQVQRNFVIRNGQVEEDITFERRAVALSMEGARAASENGTPTDYWNGFTWLREGFKPELDFPTMAKAAAEGQNSTRKVFSRPASPIDAARLQYELNRSATSQPPLPVEPAAATTTSTRRTSSTSATTSS